MSYRNKALLMADLQVTEYRLTTIPKGTTITFVHDEVDSHKLICSWEDAYGHLHVGEVADGTLMKMIDPTDAWLPVRAVVE